MTLDLDHLEALAKGATSGPWRVESRDGLEGSDGCPIIRGQYGHDGYFERDEDAAYCAATNPATILALIAEVRALREMIRLQANAAHAGMVAAKRSATILYEEAQKARAESSPELLASERVMNAMLTAENEALREDAERYRFARESIQESYALPGGFYLSESGGESWDKTIDAARREKE